MALWGSLFRIEEQLIENRRFTLALAYLRLALKPGTNEFDRILRIPVGETRRIDLGEGVFALEQVYQSKPKAEGRMEAHRAHIDLQAIVEGEELMEMTATGTLSEVLEDALESRDVAYYADGPTASVLHCGPGDIAVFFPADAHKPSLAVDDKPAIVRKTVVKVAVN
jgi:YhcH/YjgK/YiaL family protein